MTGLPRLFLIALGVTLYAVVLGTLVLNNCSVADRC